MFVYFYDVKPKRKGDYGKLKRRFYYHFNKIRLSEFSFKTKSVFAVTDRYEKILDSFFLGFKGEVEVYKVKTDGVEQLC